MTGAVLGAIYLLALAVFLGLDIISKVPPTLYALVLAGLGMLSAVSLVGAFHLLGPATSGDVGILGRQRVLGRQLPLCPHRGLVVGCNGR